MTPGYTVPLLGLGVYENDDCVPACLAALNHGYRYVPPTDGCPFGLDVMGHWFRVIDLP